MLYNNIWRIYGTLIVSVDFLLLCCSVVFFLFSFRSLWICECSTEWIVPCCVFGCAITLVVLILGLHDIGLAHALDAPLFFSFYPSFFPSFFLFLPSFFSPVFSHSRTNFFFSLSTQYFIIEAIIFDWMCHGEKHYFLHFNWNIRAWLGKFVWFELIPLLYIMLIFCVVSWEIQSKIISKMWFSF